MSARDAPYSATSLTEREAFEAFLDAVRAVLEDHWSGLPEHRPSEQLWARLDAVLFDEDGRRLDRPRFEEVLREQ